MFAPARDGVYARVRNILRRYGVPVGIGVAVGVGAGAGVGYQIASNCLNNKTSTTTVNSTTSNPPTIPNTPTIITSTTESKVNTEQ